jgi:hypothetical protein
VVVLLRHERNVERDRRRRNPGVVDGHPAALVPERDPKTGPGGRDIVIHGHGAQRENRREGGKAPVASREVRGRGLGFALAYLCSPSAAPAVANLLFLVLAFGSGMLIRIDQMPDFLRAIAPYLPTYHYAQLSWGALGAATEDSAVSVAWLAGFTVLFFGVAAWAHRREAARKFT